MDWNLNVNYVLTVLSLLFFLTACPVRGESPFLTAPFWDDDKAELNRKVASHVHQIKEIVNNMEDTFEAT